MINSARLNEIFCKQVSEIGKLHKYQHIFLMEFQWFMDYTLPLSAIVYE